VHHHTRPLQNQQFAFAWTHFPIRISQPLYSQKDAWCSGPPGLFCDYSQTDPVLRFKVVSVYCFFGIDCGSFHINRHNHFLLVSGLGILPHRRTPKVVKHTQDQSRHLSGSDRAVTPPLSSHLAFPFPRHNIDWSEPIGTTATMNAYSGISVINCIRRNTSQWFALVLDDKQAPQVRVEMHMGPWTERQDTWNRSSPRITTRALVDDVNEIGVLEPRASLTRSIRDAMYRTVTDPDYSRSPEWLCRRQTAHSVSPQLTSQTREWERLTPTERLNWGEEVDFYRTGRGRVLEGNTCCRVPLLGGRQAHRG